MLSWLVYGSSFTNGRIYCVVLIYRKEIIFGIWTVGWTTQAIWRCHAVGSQTIWGLAVWQYLINSALSTHWTWCWAAHNGTFLYFSQPSTVCTHTVCSSSGYAIRCHHANEQHRKHQWCYTSAWVITCCNPFEKVQWPYNFISSWQLALGRVLLLFILCCILLLPLSVPRQSCLNAHTPSSTPPIMCQICSFEFISNWMLFFY